MERGAFDRFLGPPPRLVTAAEALPHLAGLVLAPFRGELPDEMELHPVEQLKDAFDDAAAREMLKRAFSLPKVRDRVGRGRIVQIGISRRGEPAKNERYTYLAVAYDYTANVAIEISLDEHGELLGIREDQYQPPPTEGEIERATELARLDTRIASKVEGLVAMAIPYAGAEDEFANRRVLEVLFGCRAERLPKYRAWVDLGTESVLHAAGTDECCNGHRSEVRS